MTNGDKYCTIYDMTLQKISGEKVTAIRKVVDSSVLADIFDLPSTFKDKKLEVLLFPMEESTEETPLPPKNKFPLFTREQIEEAAKAPEIQALVGALKGANLPHDISMKDIRNARLAEKHNL